MHVTVTSSTKKGLEDGVANDFFLLHGEKRKGYAEKKKPGSEETNVLARGMEDSYLPPGWPGPL